MFLLIKILIFSILATSLSYSTDLSSKYKEMMNTPSNPTQGSIKDKLEDSVSTDTQQTYDLADDIKKIKALKRDTFESSSEFNARIAAAIAKLRNKVKFFARNGSKEYSAGTATMESYDADKERMKLRLTWNNDLKSVFPEIKNLTTVYLNISRKEAKALFSDQPTHYFHITITHLNNSFTISKMLIYDKFELHKPFQKKYNNPSTSKRPSTISNNIDKTQVITYEENGIQIIIVYPKLISAGQSFIIKAKMLNNYRSAKQGGLTLSFPDIHAMEGKILNNNFSTIKGYSYPDKIYNKHARKALPANYFMIEGWQNKKWNKGQTKYFTVELKAPYSAHELKINLRAVLWIRNKHNIREIPTKSHIFDQQGFPVKQFTINITK